MNPPAQEGREQRATIEECHHQNEVLKMNLARESRVSRQAADMSTSSGSDLLRLQKEADTYLRQIDAERRMIDELEQKKDEIDRKTAEQRSLMGGINASKENQEMVNRQLKLLQNRLDKAQMNFNHADAQNKQLRAEIDALRKQRVVFDGIYKKLERELHEKKKEMAAIVEESKKAHDQRQRATAEMGALKSQTQKDKDDFDREWAELGRLMDLDRQAREAAAAEKSALVGQGPTSSIGAAGDAAKGGDDTADIDAAIAARNSKDAGRRKSNAVALAHEDDDYDSDEEDVDETCKDKVKKQYGTEDKSVLDAAAALEGVKVDDDKQQ